MKVTLEWRPNTDGGTISAIDVEELNDYGNFKEASTEERKIILQNWLDDNCRDFLYAELKDFGIVQ